jgi:hypothetical protein
VISAPGKIKGALAAAELFHPPRDGALRPVAIAGRPKFAERKNRNRAVVAEITRQDRRHRLHVWRMLLFLLAIYAVSAYFVIPYGWKHYARRHPELEDIPRITHTASGIPGDALNVELIGTERDLKSAMIAAHWYPADSLTLRSCLEIAEATVLKRAYDDAPVSNLYLFGRREDLAFEKPVGNNPRAGITCGFGAIRRRMPRIARSGWVRPPTTKASASATARDRSPTTRTPTSMPSATFC